MELADGKVPLFSSNGRSMRNVSSVIRQICLATAMLAGAAAQAGGPPTLSITTHSGKLLTGQLDSKTTDTRLWVRRESERILLATSIAWSEVAEAQLDGEPIEVSALKEQREGLASERAFGFLAQTPPDRKYASFSKRKSIRLTNIEVDAAVVNLDRDVEPDGIELVLAVVDVHGRNVLVRGTMSVRLIGERRDHHTGRIRIEDIQRWSQQVSEKDFVDGVARYALPFRRVHPEQELDLGPHALVHVRLGAFGHGNYEASVPLPLRQFNPFRDRLQQIEGSRFVRGERNRHIRRGAVIHGPRQRYVGPW